MICFYDIIILAIYYTRGMDKVSILITGGTASFRQKFTEIKGRNSWTLKQSVKN